MNPLNLVIANPEIKQQRIETDVLFPMNISDNAVGGQPVCRFVLKNRGFLSPDSRLVLPATVTSTSYQYSPLGGCFSLLKRATLRVGSVVVQQVEDCGLLMSQMNLLRPLEHRELIDRPLHGVLSSFESASGSNDQYGNDRRDAEVLIGQHRVKGDKPAKNVSRPRPGGDVNYMETQEHEAYRLQSSTTHNSATTDTHPNGVMGTPEFSIPLSSIFQGYMGNQLELPVSLINPDQKIEIELEFSQDGAWGVNERVILEGSETNAGGLGHNQQTYGDSITAGGTDYSVNDVLSVGGAGTGGVIQVTQVNAGTGAVERYKVLNTGVDYVSAAGVATANLEVADAAATGCTLDLTNANTRRAQYDQSLFDTKVTGQKCVIDTSNVRLLCDYIFYEDGKAEQVAAQMMSQGGLTMPYTQFRTIKSTLPANLNSGNSVGISEGSSSDKTFTRQIGLANEVYEEFESEEGYTDK